MTFRLRKPTPDLNNHLNPTASSQTSLTPLPVPLPHPVPTATPATTSPPPRPRLPSGVVVSHLSGHPVTSWGLAQIDSALNGGLPLSTLTVVVEDCPTRYHVPLLSYVTAQGIRHGHAVAVASFSTPVDTIMQRLPGPASSVSSSSSHPPHNPPAAHSSDHDLKIAWRYKKQTQHAAFSSHPSSPVPSSPAHPPRHYHAAFVSDFDLSVKPPPINPSRDPISCIPVSLSSADPLATLLADLKSHLVNAAKRRLFSRLVVHSLPVGPQYPTERLVRFLTALRTLARVHGCVVVVSTPAFVPYRAFRPVADALLRVDSFDGLGTKVAGLGAEWLGVLVVSKCFRFGKGPAFPGRGDVWVFKRGRRKYTMERATCAPDDESQQQQKQRDGDTTASQKKQSPTTNAICASSLPNSNSDASYDF